MARQRIQARPRPMFNGGPDPITLHKMQQILNQGRQLLSERKQFFDSMRGPGGNGGPSPTGNASFPVAGMTSIQHGPYFSSELDPRRNMAQDCGYPTTISPQAYKDLIDREPYAGFANGLYPLESNQVEPYVYEDDDDKTFTPFEESLLVLNESLQSGREPSWFDTESSSVLNQLLLNLDLLMGYGRYGVLMIGLDDGVQDLSTPAVPKKGQRCTYLRAFPEHLARITMFDMDWSSPRYGQPTSYLITFADPQDMSTTGVNENFMAQQVHWSRVVHVTDFWHHPSSSPIFAIERCKPVLNPILDARKIRGSSAEGYYQSCFNALHFGTHPQLGPDVDIDRDSILDAYEQFANGLQRIFVTSGMTLNPIAPTLPDAEKHLLIQLVAMCIKMRVPMRIAMGSERGELASGDDKVKWVHQLMSRQKKHNTPKVWCPVIDRLINLGVLEQPKQGYKIEWPEIDIQTAAERVKNLLTRTQAYSTYAATFEHLVPPHAFMTEFDMMEPDKAETIIEEGEKHAEEVQEKDLDYQADLTKVQNPELDDDGENEKVAAVTVQNGKAKKGKPPVQNSGDKRKRIVKKKRITNRDASDDTSYEKLASMFGMKPGKEVPAREPEKPNEGKT